MTLLTAAQIARVARDAGFRGEALTTAVAIAYAESGGRSDAHNPVPPDDSYGLWQINMIGSLGPARREQFGLSSNSELWNPATNARAAFAISSRGGNFNPWTTYVNQSYRLHLNKAQQGVQNIGEAGPIPEGGGGGGSYASARPISVETSTQTISFTPDAEQANLTFSFEMGHMLANLFRNIGPDASSNLFGGAWEGITGIASVIGNIADMLTIWTTSLVKAAVWVGNPDNWMRIVQVGVGGMLVYGGAVVTAKPVVAPLVATGQQVAASVPGAGKAAGAAKGAAKSAGTKVKSAAKSAGKGKS